VKQPNILLVVSDQEQSWDLLPPGLERPGLERLRARGTSFTRSHMVALPCGPGRSVLYTGQHTVGTGLHVNPNSAGVHMSTDVPTIGAMLRAHGYATAYKGKWHLSRIVTPDPMRGSAVNALEEYGFSEFNPGGDVVGLGWEGYGQDPVIVSAAARWLQGHGGKPTDRPWFLAVNFINPHDVMFYDATGAMNATGTVAEPRMPAPLDPIYEREWDLPLPVSFTDDLSGKPASQRARIARMNGLLGEIPRADEAAWRRLRSYYLNCLADLDRHVGRLLDVLAATGHDRDTVVVYTTDHGEGAGAHGFRDKPHSLYREVLNTPLVIAHPDAPSQVESSALVSCVDLAPTILGLAGVSAEVVAEAHPQLRGHDVSALVGQPRRTSSRDDEGILVSMGGPALGPDFRGTIHGLIDQSWKLGRYFGADDPWIAAPGRLAADGDLELYDLDADPHELDNLAYRPEYAAQLDHLGRRLTALVARELGTADPRPLGSLGHRVDPSADLVRP
jgi:arylsulfatase A-like enzyme